ncbi:hypothetical protein [Fluviispira multicolorata]|uniref:STAS domain-containing protein n=1 Tax=Fluviispira multicolorata TaxID=2654512 RepID=A0A833JF21_9BACT|nr:hypothetical protein [Fluviispira multicolorata]KAB8033494.1 hypothetical protein GCL57_01970 [Fluviispira multicolorata]
MTSELSIKWKRDDYVSIAGIIDENANFSDLTNRKTDILYIDLKDVARINSSGVRKWVNAIEMLKEVELHYINCACSVVDQLSMVPEFIGRKCTVESFDAEYACETCNNTQIFTLVVGYDIEPGLTKYLDGPEKFCQKCKNRLEFNHNPDSYLFFLSKLSKKRKK